MEAEGRSVVEDVSEKEQNSGGLISKVPRVPPIQVPPAGAIVIQTKVKSYDDPNRIMDKKNLKQFRFGVPLDQLPCTYLPDYGNVVTFLVEAGDIIRQHVDVEGLFRKSADLSHQDELKLQAERGQGLEGDLDVHEVTGLVRTFFRLLPEPLLPCLFHDPFLTSMDLPQASGQRTEAVQELCFALPASHLSCLRYFMKLLVHITRHVDKNRMNARNLAVVLTPSLIRLKVRTKLMSPEELRVLPKQTALIEHLICHADGIGCMTSKLYQHSVQMAEDLLQKKLSPKKKKKGNCCTDLEERLGAARAVLNVVATLHFRPNSSAAVSDTVLVDGPYRQAVTAGSNLQNLEPQPASHNKREADNITKAPLNVSLNKTCSGRCRHKPRKRLRNNTRRSSAPMERSDCKVMLEPLIQSWSTAIPVLSYSSKSDSDLESCSSKDSCWSDEDADYSNSDEEKMMSEAVEQILNEHPFLAKRTNSSFNTEYSSSSETITGEDRMLPKNQKNIEETQLKSKEECKLASKEDEDADYSNSDEEKMMSEAVEQILNEHPFLAKRTNSSFNTEYSSSSETITGEDRMLPKNQKNIEETQQKSNEECKLASKELTYSDEVVYSDRHSTPFESYSNGHSLVPEYRTDCHIFSEERNSNAGKEENKYQTTNVTNTSCLPSEESSKLKTADVVQETCDQSVHPSEDQVKESLNQQENDTDQKAEVILKLSTHLSESEFQQECKNSTSKKVSKISDNDHPKEQTSIPCNGSRTEGMTTKMNMNTTCCSLADNTDQTNTQIKQEESLLPPPELCKKDGTHSGTLHQHSQSADADSKTLNQHSQSVVAESEKLNQHSQSVDADSGILNQHSQRVVADSGILNQHSQSVDADSGILNQHSQSVVADRGILNQHSQSVDADSGILNQHSQSVVADSGMLNQHSQSAVVDSGKLNQHSQSVVADSGILNQHSQSVVADSGILNQHSQSVVADSGKLNQHSQSVVADSKTLNQHSQSVDADSGKVNQHSQSVVADSKTLNQNSQSVDADSGILNQHSQSVDADSGILNQHSQSVVVYSGKLNQLSQSVVADRETLNRLLQSANGQQLPFTSKLLSTFLQHHGILNSSAEAVSAVPSTQPAGRLKKHLLQLAQRYHSMEEQQASESTNDANILRQNWKDEKESTSFSKNDKDPQVSELTSESERSLSMQHVTNQCQFSFPQPQSIHLTNPPNQTRELPYDKNMENLGGHSVTTIAKRFRLFRAKPATSIIL